MPTGYTSEIYHGEEVSPKDFLLTCARAFGATISMREEPLNAEIPEFEPSNYYKDALTKELSELDRYTNMSLKGVEMVVDTLYQNQLNEYKKISDNQKQLLKRYTKLLECIKEWEPPTSEHISLKEFAIDQLKASIKTDCNPSLIREVVRHDPEEWLKMKIEKTRDNIEWYKQMYQEEVERVNRRNEWIKNLRGSVIGI